MLFQLFVEKVKRAFSSKLKANTFGFAGEMLESVLFHFFIEIVKRAFISKVKANKFGFSG